MLPPDTPLYNHPLPQIEQWLKEHGCQQDRDQLHCWRVQRPNWSAELWLDIEQISVRYIQAAETVKISNALLNILSVGKI